MMNKCSIYTTIKIHIKQKIKNISLLSFVIEHESNYFRKEDINELHFSKT